MNISQSLSSKRQYTKNKIKGQIKYQVSSQNRINQKAQQISKINNYIKLKLKTNRNIESTLSLKYSSCDNRCKTLDNMGDISSQKHSSSKFFKNKLNIMSNLDKENKLNLQNKIKSQRNYENKQIQKFAFNRSIKQKQKFNNCFDHYGNINTTLLKHNEQKCYRTFDISKLNFDDHKLFQQSQSRNSAKNMSYSINLQQNSSKRNLNSFCLNNGFLQNQRFKQKQNRLSTQFQSTKKSQSLVKKSASNIQKISILNKLLKQNHQIRQNIKLSNEDKIIGNIQILSKLRTGCFGSIFKAKLKDKNKLVAIKKISYNVKYNQREPDICKLLNNPFVIKIHEIYYTCENQNQKLKQKQIKQDKQLLIDSQSEDQLQNTSKGTKSKKLLRTTSNVKVKHKEIKQEILKRNNIANIVMDLYQCDLHDYIQMKSCIDSLSIKIFSYQILRAVMYLHSNQICHRDIKPQNIFLNKHRLVLGDFGSAKIMKKHKNSSVAYICSRYYRAPQLILGYKHYDKSVDIWSTACVFAEIALGKPIFKGSSSLDQLIKRVLGTPNWRKLTYMAESMPKIPFIQGKGLKQALPNQTSPKFIDLLQKMLVINPLHRLTAGQALSHSYFDQIRDQVSFNQINKQMDIDNFIQFDREELKESQHLKNRLIPLWYTQLNVQKTTQNNFFTQQIQT